MRLRLVVGVCCCCCCMIFFPGGLPLLLTLYFTIHFVLMKFCFFQNFKNKKLIKKCLISIPKYLLYYKHSSISQCQCAFSSLDLLTIGKHQQPQNSLELWKTYMLQKSFKPQKIFFKNIQSSTFIVQNISLLYNKIFQQFTIWYRYRTPLSKTLAGPYPCISNKIFQQINLKKNEQQNVTLNKYLKLTK